TFPFLLGVFMRPKLAVVCNQITLPLQLLASRIAAGMLSIGGIAVARSGNILNVAGRQIAVVDACSGVRYLLPLGFIAVLFAYIADTKPWMRLGLLANAVPVSIVANALRVAAAGLVPALDAGAPHALSGWFVFVICLAMLMAARRAINAVHARYYA